MVEHQSRKLGVMSSNLIGGKNILHLFVVMHLFEVPCCCHGFGKTMADLVHKAIALTGSLAEWSKALVLGTSPKGRGFESHSCQSMLFVSFRYNFFDPQLDSMGERVEEKHCH